MAQTLIGWRRMVWNFSGIGLPQTDYKRVRNYDSIVTDRGRFRSRDKCGYRIAVATDAPSACQHRLYERGSASAERVEYHVPFVRMLFDYARWNLGDEFRGIRMQAMRRVGRIQTGLNKVGQAVQRFRC